APSAHLQLDGRLELEDLEAEVGADLQAREAPRAPRYEPWIAEPELVDLGRVGHDEHVRRTGGDAELAALARGDVDRDGPARQHLHAGTTSHAGAASFSVESHPARMARSLLSTCCRRYGGIDSRMPSSAPSSVTNPVIAAYAPTMTIDAPIELPRAAASSVTRTS